MTPNKPTRSELVSVLGEIFSAVPQFNWRKVTEHISPPCREWFADAVDEYFRDDPIEDGPPLTTERWWNTPPPAPKVPCPEGFHWIGQPAWSCDQCGLPAWEHAGRATYSSPFSDEPPTLTPWEPGVAEGLRLRWEPQMPVKVTR